MPSLGLQQNKTRSYVQLQVLATLFAKPALFCNLFTSTGYTRSTSVGRPGRMLICRCLQCFSLSPCCFATRHWVHEIHKQSHCSVEGHLPDPGLPPAGSSQVCAGCQNRSRACTPQGNALSQLPPPNLTPAPHPPAHAHAHWLEHQLCDRSHDCTNLLCEEAPALSGGASEPIA